MFSARAVTAISLAFILAACTQQTATQSAPAVKGPAGKLLASVNGYPITEYDVRVKLQTMDPEMELRQDQISGALEELIVEELKYRKASQLGLDKDTAYQEKITEAMAYLNYFKREGMSRLFQQEQVIAKSVTSDEEARKFFDANKQMIQTEVRVWQVLSRDADDIEKVMSAIKGGTPFIDVVKARFPNLPKGLAPWDVGYLHWNQVPETWLDELSRMKNGDVSGVIMGPRGRAWIIQLVDRRINPDINFENQMQTIKLFLTEKKKKELAETTLEALRKNAKIVYQGK
ncbi:MAG: hypothetical protein A3F73_14285 [Gallionellales bacterium RIFCSPLOWO2_12_FULL_59_22]|nr:MAG: hypothetical protein A3H99_01595 [Gallionellales bacterium RIFCSPLOWO2_02_FULL_59_110]OGT14723.1 MAG: hypothetical protein A3F73_14285 [Gallionellales bacterium RIFCSPLOWO2_12_FULL_59_22]